MQNTSIREITKVLIGDLAVSGDWVVASIQADIAWTVNAENLEFRGHQFWIIPVSINHYPGLAIKRPAEMSVETAQELLMRLASAISWAKNSGILIVSITKPCIPQPAWREKTTGFSISSTLDLPDLPEPQDTNGQLALALMREGRGLNHPAYSFLSFYRVIETSLPPKRRGTWIADAIVRMTDQRGLEAADKLRVRGVTALGTHIYEARRMAIAHATRQPIVDPDDAATAMQLRDELPLMEALAIMAMEELLGIETSSTQFRKHLYELDGFKRHFGADFVDRVIAEQQPAEGATIDLPILAVGLRRKDPYTALSALRPVWAQQVGKSVRVVLRDEQDWVEMPIILNFSEDRLGLDLSGLKLRDDGTAACATAQAEVALFTRDYFGNGQLEIRDAGTGERFSRVDAFIPVNCYLDWDGSNAIIEEWKAKASQRSSKSVAETAPI